MEKLVITQLSEPQVRKIVREEVKQVVSQCLNEQKEKEKPTYLTVEQLADYLNTTVSAIYGKVYRKEVPHIKRGKRLLFCINDIDAWLKSGTVKTRAAIKQEAKSFVNEFSGKY